jgi:hypothetical protein
VGSRTHGLFLIRSVRRRGLRASCQIAMPAVLSGRGRGSPWSTTSSRTRRARLSSGIRDRTRNLSAGSSRWPTRTGRGPARWHKSSAPGDCAGAGGEHGDGSAGAALSRPGGGAWLGTAIMSQPPDDVGSAEASDKPSGTRRMIHILGVLLAVVGVIAGAGMRPPDQWRAGRLPRLCHVAPVSQARPGLHRGPPR